MGETGRAGGAAGDLYVTIHIRSSLIQKVKELFTALRSALKPG